MAEPVRADVCSGNQKEAVRINVRPYPMALAFGRSFRPDQWRNLRPLAGGRSWAQSPWGIRHKRARPQGRIGVSEEVDETIPPSGGHRHRPHSLIAGSHERDRQHSPPRDPPLAQQSGRKITSVVQATRWAMAKFRSPATLQEFAAVNASVHNYFNQERHLYSRKKFKLDRYAVLAEWREFSAA